MNNSTYGFSDLEPLRKKTLLYSRLTFIGVFVLFCSFVILPFAIFFINLLGGGWFFVLLFYACFGVAAKIVTERRKAVMAEYIKAYKEVLVAPALAKVFDSCTYHPEEGISTEEVLGLGRWNRDDYKSFRTTSEDLLTGTYKGVHYEQSDLTVRAGAKGNNQNTVRFSGCVSRFRFNKNVAEKIIICTDSYSYPPSGLSGVRTENEAFNSTFNVYTKSDHDAFSVLTPHFTEAVLKLEKATPPASPDGMKKGLWMLFENNTLTIIRDDVMMFGVPVVKESDFLAEKKSTIQDMRQLLDIVNALNIDC